MELTEAAQLYLKDLSVLEEARTELKNYLKINFWDGMREEILERSTSYLNEGVKIGVGNYNKRLTISPIFNSLYFELNDIKLGLRVYVYDPFTTELGTSGTDCVGVLVNITKGGRLMIAKSAGYEARLSELAQNHGITLDWSAPAEGFIIIAYQESPVTEHGLTETRTELIDYLERGIKFIQEAEAWYQGEME